MNLLHLSPIDSGMSIINSRMLVDPRKSKGCFKRTWWVKWEKILDVYEHLCRHHICERFMVFASTFDRSEVRNYHDKWWTCWEQKRVVLIGEIGRENDEIYFNPAR